MNKNQLVAALAAKTGQNKKDAEAAVDALFDTIGQALKEGDRVQLANFGIFEIKERAARTGYNPRTGGKMEIAASNKAVFKPAKALRDLLG